jgi:hypothetical protein
MAMLNMNSDLCESHLEEERSLASFIHRLIEIAAVSGVRGSDTSAIAVLNAMRLPAKAARPGISSPKTRPPSPRSQSATGHRSTFKAVGIRHGVPAPSDRLSEAHIFRQHPPLLRVTHRRETTLCFCLNTKAPACCLCLLMCTDRSFHYLRPNTPLAASTEFRCVSFPCHDETPETAFSPVLF